MSLAPQDRETVHGWPVVHREGDALVVQQPSGFHVYCTGWRIGIRKTLLGATRLAKRTAKYQ